MGKVLLMCKAWNEGQHPRDGQGRFSLAPDMGGSPATAENNLEKFKDAMRETLESMAVPRMKVAYTEESYKKLFGEWKRVDTPVGRVVVPQSQFEKLEKTDRKGWLGAMYQTITDPVLIIQESPERKLFVKTFTPEKEGVITFLSVIIEDGQSKLNITNHEKTISNVLHKIKNAGAVVYKKPASTGGGSRIVGKSQRLPLPAGGESGKPDSHLPIVSLETLKKSRVRLGLRRKIAASVLDRMGVNQ